MTIFEEALKGIITSEMLQVAESEKVDSKEVSKHISKGRIVIMQRDNFNPIGIGFPLRTKINVNLGTSSSTINIDEEFKKVEIAQRYGADTISDLSMGGDIDAIRRNILNISYLPLTTVPIYQAVIEAGSFSNVS